jgi:hypothetical protein
MYFDMKSYLKNNRNHTVKHALSCNILNSATLQTRNSQKKHH